MLYAMVLVRGVNKVQYDLETFSLLTPSPSERGENVRLLSLVHLLE